VIRTVLREPLVQFLAAGAALFLLFRWTGVPVRDENARIVVTRGDVEILAGGFARTWRRAPSEGELKGLVDDFVREEIARREATAMGLDRGDTILSRWLRQKFEFLVEDSSVAEPPGEEDLRAYFASRAEEFREEPRVTFRQTILKRESRGAAVEADARALLDELRRAGANADLSTRGDPFSLPSEFTLAPAGEVAGLFGDAFAAWLFAEPAGEWEGPVESPYGWHLVLVRERVEGRLPPLDEVRETVTREVLAARRKERLEATYARLLEKYAVETEGFSSAADVAAGAAAEALR